MFSSYLHYSVGLIYLKNVAIIDPQKQTCVVGTTKRGDGGVVVK